MLTISADTVNSLQEIKKQKYVDRSEINHLNSAVLTHRLR